MGLKSPDDLIDTTCRTICTTFEEYTNLYETMAKLTRLAYCDSGIIKKVFEEGIGSSTEDVMKSISANERKYRAERTTPLKTQEGLGKIPHESYALGPAPKATAPKYATYISTSEVATALVLNASYLKSPIFKPNDVIICFKGTSTIKEVIHDIKSQFSSITLKNTLSQLGLQPVKGDEDAVLNGAFTKVLLDAWNVLVKGITDHSGTGSFRLFCTGHSLGGAYTTLFGFLLAYMKNIPSPPELASRIESIHILSLGSPKVCDSKLRNIFNSMLISNQLTFDRLVSQYKPTLKNYILPVSAAFAGVDIIPNLPLKFSHPGFRPKKEDPKFPYSLSDIAKRYEQTVEVHAPPALPEEEQKEMLSDVKEETAGLEEPVQEGGGVFDLFKSKNKRDYNAMVEKYSSNFISVGVPNTFFAKRIAHIFYFGLNFFNGLRLPGMKNPVPPGAQKVATFEFYDEPDAGVLIKYKSYSALAISKGRNGSGTGATGRNGSGNASVTRKTPSPLSATGMKNLLKKIRSTPYLGGRKTRRASRAKKHRA